MPAKLSVFLRPTPQGSATSSTLPPINQEAYFAAGHPVDRSSLLSEQIIRLLLRMSHLLEPLKAVTHNLPSFMRQPLIAVISKECYTSLVWSVESSVSLPLSVQKLTLLPVSPAGTSIFQTHSVSLIPLARSSALVWLQEVCVPCPCLSQRQD